MYSVCTCTPYRSVCCLGSVIDHIMAGPRSISYQSIVEYRVRLRWIKSTKQMVMIIITDYVLTRKVLYWLVRTFMNALGSRVNADHPHILDYRSIRCGSIPWYLWLRGIFHSGSDRDLVRFSPDSSGRNKDPELREPCHYTEYTRYLNARSIVSTDYGRLMLSISAEYTLPIELCSAMLDEHEQCVH